MDEGVGDAAFFGLCVVTAAVGTRQRDARNKRGAVGPPA